MNARLAGKKFEELTNALRVAFPTEAKLARFARPPSAVTQRALDHQDGVVLVLLDALVGGMKLLRRACPLVERPTYGTLSGRYATRPGGGRAPKTTERGVDTSTDEPVAPPPVK